MTGIRAISPIQGFTSHVGIQDPETNDYRPILTALHEDDFWLALASELPQAPVGVVGCPEAGILRNYLRMVTGCDDVTVEEDVYTVGFGLEVRLPRWARVFRAMLETLFPDGELVFARTALVVLEAALRDCSFDAIDLPWGERRWHHPQKCYFLEAAEAGIPGEPLVRIPSMRVGALAPLGPAEAGTVGAGAPGFAAREPETPAFLVLLTDDLLETATPAALEAFAARLLDPADPFGDGDEEGESEDAIADRLRDGWGTVGGLPEASPTQHYVIEKVLENDDVAEVFAAYLAGLQARYATDLAPRLTAQSAAPARPAAGGFETGRGEGLAGLLAALDAAHWGFPTTPAYDSYGQSLN